jgi:hypothetical protein
MSTDRREKQIGPEVASGKKPQTPSKPDEGFVRAKAQAEAYSNSELPEIEFDPKQAVDLIKGIRDPQERLRKLEEIARNMDSYLEIIQPFFTHWVGNQHEVPFNGELGDIQENIDTCISVRNDARRESKVAGTEIEERDKAISEIERALKNPDGRGTISGRTIAVAKGIEPESVSSRASRLSIKRPLRGRYRIADVPALLSGADIARAGIPTKGPTSSKSNTEVGTSAIRLKDPFSIKEMAELLRLLNDESNPMSTPLIDTGALAVEEYVREHFRNQRSDEKQSTTILWFGNLISLVLFVVEMCNNGLFLVTDKEYKRRLIVSGFRYSKGKDASVKPNKTSVSSYLSEIDPDAEKHNSDENAEPPPPYDEIRARQEPKGADGQRKRAYEAINATVLNLNKSR